MNRQRKGKKGKGKTKSAQRNNRNRQQGIHQNSRNWKMPQKTVKVRPSITPSPASDPFTTWVNLESKVSANSNLKDIHDAAGLLLAQGRKKEAQNLLRILQTDPNTKHTTENIDHRRDIRVESSDIRIEKIRSPRPAIGLTKLGDFKLLHDQARLQNPNTARNVEQARSVALRIIKPNGEFQSINTLRQIKQTILKSDQTLLPQSRHLIAMLDRLAASNSPLRQRIENLEVAAPNGPVYSILQATLGLPKDATFSLAQTRQAVLSALFTQLRQSAAASCGPTSLAIQVQQQNPIAFINDLESLIQKGKLVRIINKGKNLPIASDLYTKAVNRALRTLDIGQQLEEKIRQKVTKALQQKNKRANATVSLNDIESTIQNIAKQEKVSIEEDWHPLTHIEVPINLNLLPPDDLETVILLGNHPVALLHKVPGIKAALEALSIDAEQDQKKAVQNAIGQLQKSLSHALKSAIRAMECHPFFKFHLLTVLPAKVNDETDASALEEVLKKEVQAFLSVSGAVPDFLGSYLISRSGKYVFENGKYVIDFKKLKTLATEARDLATAMTSVTPADILAQLAGNDSANRVAVTQAFQAQQENLLLRTWEFTVANLAMEYDGGEQLKTALEKEFQDVVASIFSPKQPKNLEAEFLKDEIYRMLKRLKAIYDPSKVGGSADGASSRGGMVLVDSSQNVKLDMPKAIVSLVIKRLEASIQQPRVDPKIASDVKQNLQRVKTELQKKWPSPLSVYIASSVWPDDLISAYNELQSVQIDTLKPQNSKALFDWLVKQGKKKPTHQTTTKLIRSIWNDLHAFSFRPGEIAVIAPKTFVNDQNKLNNQRLKQTEFPIARDNAPLDAMLQRLIYKTLLNFYPQEAENAIGEYLQSIWKSPKITLDDLKRVIDWHINQWEVKSPPRMKYVLKQVEHSFYQSILEVSPLIPQASYSTAIDRALKKLQLSDKDSAQVKKQMMSDLKNLPQASMVQMKQALDKALTAAKVKDQVRHTEDKLYEALRQPAGVVFADSNWGGNDLEDGNQLTVFSMVVNPLSKTLEMWKMNEDGSDPQPLGEHWIQGPTKVPINKRKGWSILDL